MHNYYVVLRLLLSVISKEKQGNTFWVNMFVFKCVRSVRVVLFQLVKHHTFKSTVIERKLHDSIWTVLSNIVSA